MVLHTTEIITGVAIIGTINKTLKKRLFSISCQSRRANAKPMIYSIDTTEKTTVPNVAKDSQKRISWKTRT